MFSFKYKFQKKVPLQAHVCENKCRIMDGKRIYKTDLPYADKGSATIEASIVIPLLIMLVYALFTFGNFLITRSVIYEGFQETAQYMAEYEYLYEKIDAGIVGATDAGIIETAINTSGMYKKLEEFIDDAELVSRYVDGGISGIKCRSTYFNSTDGYVYMEISYRLRSEIALFGSFGMDITEKLRQKAYLGVISTGIAEAEETYVYVAENGRVYHRSRSCYHIALSIKPIGINELRTTYDNLEPCKYCARNKSCTGKIYITKTGDKYHYNLSCSGLKRTVSRVKLSEANGLPPCSNCGYQ
jgi:hypothetical protein